MPNLKAKLPTGYMELGVILSILGMAIVFTCLNQRFASLEALGSMISLAAELGIIAIGESFLLIAGEIDLSVGSVFAVAPMLVIWLLNSGIPFILAFLVALGLAAAVGLANALITIRGRIPSFITTLGTMWFIRGVLLAITRGFPVRLEVDVPELAILSAPIIYDLRISGLWFLILVVIFHFILMSTSYGNWVQAVGGAPETARALGINVNKVKIINFVLCSVMAALAGIIAMSRFKVVEPVAGMGLELEAIAASVIGGCSLTGGVGTIVGAALGAFLIGEIRVGLIMAGAPAYWYIGFVGLLLIIAGIINLRLSKRE